MSKNEIERHKDDKAVARTVDEYIASAPAEWRSALEHLRQMIRAAAPQATESISYRIPTYKYHGSLVHFAAFKNHCSLIAVSRKVVEAFTGELKGYTISGTTIRFTAVKPLPDELVRKIIRARMKENEESADK